MTAARDLTSHPHAFIRHNVLTLSGTINNPQLQNNGTMLLKLEDYTDYYQAITRVRNRKGFAKLRNMINGTVQTKATRFYAVCPAGQGDQDTFSAYICPYNPNQALSLVLGNAVKLMFTADMSGCSFGIGIPNRNGDVLVMHSNHEALATQNSTAPQEAQQLQDLQQGQANARMLLPGSYRIFDAAQDVDQRATTIGVRSQGTWEFWYQTYNSGTTKHMVSVTKIR